MPQYYRDSIPYLSTYLNGSAVACGTSSTTVTIPTNTNTVIIHAEGAAIYWKNNSGTVAGTSAPGYVAQDNTGFIYAMDNLGSLAVIGGGTAAIAHIEFYQE